MSLSRAKELYEQKEYSKCLDECLATIEDGADLKEAYLLAAKAFLFLLHNPVDDSHFETISKTVKHAASYCTTSKEFYDLQYEMNCAKNDWEAIFVDDAICALESNPCLEQYQTYIQSFTPPAKMAVCISISFATAGMSKALAEKEGLTPDEASEKYYKKANNEYSKFTKHAEEFAAAQRIFANVQNYVDNNRSCSSDNAAVISKTAVSALLMLSMLIPDDEGKANTNEELIERMILHAQVLHYLLDTLLYCNNQAISIFLGDRNRYYRELESIYKKIQNLDSSFQIPPMPNIEGIQPQQSSGCYIATAVYGSYDCPEVWTLRRYRDYNLATTWYGRAFIKTYYAISPTLVKWFGHTEWFKKMWKGKLDNFVKKLQDDGYSSTPYQDNTY